MGAKQERALRKMAPQPPGVFSAPEEELRKMDAVLNFTNATGFSAKGSSARGFSAKGSSARGFSEKGSSARGFLQRGAGARTDVFKLALSLVSRGAPRDLEEFLGILGKPRKPTQRCSHGRGGWGYLNKFEV